jgi:tetratricopeptide (TPR) repeat protein
VRTLVETGALDGARGEYRLVRSLDAVRVPATVQSILAARIDRLDAVDKRLLQAAAVVGMDVPFALLQAIAETGEDELRKGLARLQSAEFMYEARLFPELEHSFKHALTHETAYGSVLQERRTALHGAIAEAIERLYAERLSEHVELLAHHAVRGRVLNKAVRYLREADQKAVARSAMREAAGFFEQALALLEEMPQTDDNLSTALDTRLALGPVLIGLKGQTAPEVQVLYQRALELADRLADAQRRFQVLWNFWYIRFAHGDYAAAMQAAQALLQEAERGGDVGQILEAHHSIWPTLSEMGEAQAAVRHMERGIGLYVREQHASQAQIYGGHDAGACCRWHMGLNRWVLGFPAQASSVMGDSLRLAEELQHPQTTGLALSYASWLQFQRGERATAAHTSERLIALANAHGFRPYIGYATALKHICSSERLDIAALRALCHQFGSLSVTRWRKAFCVCVFAELCAAAGDAEAGHEFMAHLGDTDRLTMYAPEVLRVEGELCARSAAPDLAQAERCWREAIELSRARAAKSFELRAAMSLARLWRERGRHGEARELLAPLYGWFTEGFDTADLRAAKVLLEELA